MIYILYGGTRAWQEQQVQKLKDVLYKFDPFKVGEVNDGTEMMLVHLTKEVIIPKDVQEKLLNTANQGESAYKDFVEWRHFGEQNLWDKTIK